MESNWPNLFDCPISFFEYDHPRHAFGNVPTQKTTLRRMCKTKYYQKPVELIRKEPNQAKQDQMKRYLPAFTPVALLHHRKRKTTFEEKIIKQWPMLMGDIDLKDNQGVDMADLKRHVARLPYVVLCAHSVRGGLWFVVRLPENKTPETLAAHFRYLQRMFRERFEIILDSSKGGNPCDLHFVSYDPEPYMNEQATIMSGSYTPLPPPKARSFSSSAYISMHNSQLLARIVRFAESAGEGKRHTHLLKAARLIGGYVAAGRLDEKAGIQALERVASHWPNFSKSQKTIRDGVQNGLPSPIDEPNVYPNQTKT